MKALLAILLLIASAQPGKAAEPLPDTDLRGLVVAALTHYIRPGFAALAEAAKAAEADAAAEVPPVHLVIAPSSVLDNWARELARWCPGLRAVKYHGPAAERKAMRLALDAQGFDVLVTR